MNTTPATDKPILIKALIAMTVLAVGAALFMPYRSETSSVVQLERVVVVGKRMDTPVAQLPQVVVVGKRVDAGPRSFAQLGRAISRLVKSV